MQSPSSPNLFGVPIAADGVGGPIFRLLESISDGFCAFDAQWRYIYLNAAARRFVAKHGAKPEELIGKCFWECFPGLRSTTLETEAQRAVQSGLSVDFEFDFPFSNEQFAIRAEPQEGGGLSLLFRKVETLPAAKKDGTSGKAEAEHQLLATIAEQSNHFIGVATPEGRGVYLNRAGRQLLGFADLAEVRTVTIQDCFPELDRPFVQETILPMLRSHGRWEGEVRFLHQRTGATIPVYYHAFAIRDEEGKITAFGTVTHDLSREIAVRDEVARLHGEVRARLAEMETLLELIPVGIGIALDRECRNIKINAEFARVLNLAPSANASKTALEPERPTSFRVLDDTGREVADADLPMQIAAREGREIRGSEFDVVQEDGTKVRLLEYAAPIFDDHGEPRGCVAAFVDITERRRAEERDRFLVELDDALRPLSDPNQIVATAARHLGEHLQADRCAYAEVEPDEDTFDCTGDHCRGVPSVVGRYRFSQFGSESLRCMRSDEPYIVSDIERHQPPPEDLAVYQMVQVRAVIAVPLYKNGKFVAAMAVHHTTARKWTDDEAELVGSVANRCWEAMARAKVTRDLAIAKEAAEAANRAKDDFLAALSHELRTPLTPVLMAAEDLCEDPTLPGAMNETLCMMRRNIDLEARLIDDLLDLTRITRGKLSLRMQQCEAHSLLGFALEIVRDEAVAKGLAIQLDLKAKRTLLECDPTRLQQVLWNLLKNAVKFTPGGGRIIVRSRDADDRITIEVSDTGVGLSPDALERVFLPFEQAGRTHEHRFGGLGLGLSISKAIVEAHQGAIEARSDGPEKGATFRIELPVADAPPGEHTEPNRDGAHTTETSDPPARQLELLLVEDHESTLAILERLLTRAGHLVSTASSVARALELAEKKRFDGVLSDIGLPDGTGIDLMRELQAKYGLTGIALSGYGMEEDLERSREAGFVSHLVKPVDYAHLRRALAQFGSRAEE